MPAPIIPWEPCNIPEELQTELNRRKVNRSFSYVDGTKGEWDQNTGDWTTYRGPMIPWIRFCSNGYGREFLDDGVTPVATPKPGFIFFSGKDFYTGYGFSKNDSGSMQGIIGYTPDGVAHTIDNDLLTSDYPIHVPAPEVEKISVTIQKELYRRATIEWVCFSKQQLEYMTPYFLVPGITCTLEWGWNHFDPRSLLRLDLVNQLKQLNNNPYLLYTNNILTSKGNYDVLFGKITHFEWSAEGNKFKCKTEITSQDRIYSGLIVDSNAVDQVKTTNGDEDNVKPLNTLTQFVNESLTQFKAVNSTRNPETIPQLKAFVQYVKNNRPGNWKQYIYGVFYGRDMEDTDNDAIQYDNKKEDFDRKAQNTNLWLNMGLIIDVINYHSSPLKSFNNKEIFRVDIDDCVIGGHPNMISSDGNILLIPNSEAPKYFEGLYGFNVAEAGSQTEKDYLVFDNSDKTLPFFTRDQSEKKDMLADYRVHVVCKQRKAKVFRDNLDVIINKIRYQHNLKSAGTFEFPFSVNKDLITGSKPYPARYSGFIKNLYFNVKCLQDLLANGEIKTYPQLIEKILEKISEASGNYWDFRLVAGTGKNGLAGSEAATMKIVDYRFMSTANRGTPYSFDYFDADSLLLGLGFKPTLSNAQAIRTIYSQTNNPNRKTTLTNGENELLDYKFKDRLFLDEEQKTETPPPRDTSGFDEIMRRLQQLSPQEGSFQITSKDQKGNVIVRRLCLPAPEVLRLLLDDGDEENNPKYTGIMPGIQATFTIQGIGGLRTFMMFLVRNLPEPYSNKNIVFRIIDIQDSIEASRWTTTITAGVIPLRNQIKARLGFTSKTS